MAPNAMTGDGTATARAHDGQRAHTGPLTMTEGRPRTHRPMTEGARQAANPDDRGRRTRAASIDDRTRHIQKGA